ncbi:MAG: hypothetical protein ACYCW6_20990 [Candidatus Xenobia bacterium]
MMEAFDTRDALHIARWIVDTTPPPPDVTALERELCRRLLAYHQAVPDALEAIPEGTCLDEYHAWLLALLWNADRGLFRSLEACLLAPKARQALCNALIGLHATEAVWQLAHRCENPRLVLSRLYRWQSERGDPAVEKTLEHLLEAGGIPLLAALHAREALRAGRPVEPVLDRTPEDEWRTRHFACAAGSLCWCAT